MRGRRGVVGALAVLLGTFGVVANAQTSDQEDILAAAGGIGVATPSSMREPFRMRAGAWEVVTEVLRSTCGAQAPETGYTGTASLGAQGEVILSMPNSPNWKLWTGRMIGNSLALTSYSDPDETRRRAASGLERRLANTLQPGVFHVILSPQSQNILVGYGFRSVNRNNGVCNESLRVTMRKL